MSYEFEKEIQIYKGKTFLSNSHSKVPIVITFDMDETLGSFLDLEILWNALFLFNKNIEISLNNLLDLYPEFIRYGILPILEFLYQKKKKGVCDKIFIYTNNQSSPEWCKMIAKYFDYKLKLDIELFDQIICAFKINNQIVELSRTTNNKTHTDFINCTLLPKKTKICFIDNTFFYEMKNDRVYYIQPKSYVHKLSTGNIIDRFLSSPLGSEYINHANLFVFSDFLHKYFSKHGIILNTSILTNDFISDIHVAQKLMYHIKEFFYLIQKKVRTKKVKYLVGRITRKKKIG